MSKYKLTALFRGFLFFMMLGAFTPALAMDNDEIVLPIELSAQGLLVASIQIQGNDIHSHIR